MKKLLAGFVICAFASVTVLADTDKSGRTYAELLSVIDGNRNVARYQSLLNQLTQHFKLSEKQIADLTAGGITVLERDGIKESGIRIMEGVNSLTYVVRGPYAEAVGMYCLFRSKGESHEDALASMESAWVALMKLKR